MAMCQKSNVRLKDCDDHFSPCFCSSSYGTYLMENVAAETEFSRTLSVDLRSPLTPLSELPPLAAFYDFLEDVRGKLFFSLHPQHLL